MIDWKSDFVLFYTQLINWMALFVYSGSLFCDFDLISIRICRMKEQRNDKQEKSVYKSIPTLNPSFTRHNQ